MLFDKFVLASLIALGATLKLPNYIPRCARYDPNLSKCFRKTVETARPYVKRGIPEIGIPPLEPFTIHYAQMDENNVRASLSGVKTYGLSRFKLKNLTLDFINNTFQGHITLNGFVSKGQYDFRYSMLEVPWTSTGSFKAKVYGVNLNVTVEAEKMFARNHNSLLFNRCHLNVTVANFDVVLESGLEFLRTKSVEAVINYRKKVVWQLALPSIQREGCRMILTQLNKIKDVMDQAIPEYQSQGELKKNCSECLVYENFE